MKDDEYPESGRGKGVMLVIAALLLAVGFMGGAFLLSKADFSPKVNVSSGATNPNVYITSTPPDHSIGVSATATQKVAPDLLEVALRVETESANAKLSQQENARVNAILLGKLKALGINDSDIQTTSYSVNPVYSSNYICTTDNSMMGNKNCYYNSTITGYTTTQTLNVDVKQLDMGGQVIDAASESGDNETFVDSTSLTLRPETTSAISKVLLKEAAADAKAKAQNIADGLGVSLGNPLSANENIYYPTPYYNSYKSLDMVAGASAPTTQLSAGSLDISVSISASYAIGG